MAGSGFFALDATAQVQTWNLPYVRPAAYNYKAYYGASLNTYLGSLDSLYFKKELQKAWGFYKTNFILANGLVNHRRVTNGTVVGANEAVSEGQGYGMILAVILNDQATFNKIFEGANQYMWDNGKKSYFTWNWPAGAKGAATDADLDIGLALVFADALQKPGLWTAYNKNGITYNSRAMEIIKSIKNAMTSQNYLLPGDNWGGDGLSNLNPSYFCTAWLRVFNAYQKEVDFSAVIENSYAVLAKVPKYSVGQAPDWCNQQGQQASQAGSKPEQGLGMLSDGIRTPYRFAMDALWFNEPRAIAYCKNSKGTLTDWANTTNLRLVAAQMAQYNKNGTSVTETRGSFDNIGMWTTAVLASKDVAYSQAVLNTTVVGLISGTSADHFGDQSLSDDKFYYKQSLGMLGLAVIGGQFPNILADVKNAVALSPVISKSQSAPKAIRGYTPQWLTSEGFPTTSVSSGPDGATNPVYRNALGRQVLPLSLH
ncbi:MAG: glycosyl hydrolase family 8 [Fibrobacteria bacterium]